jgi:hypothetical protein
MMCDLVWSDLANSKLLSGGNSCISTIMPKFMVEEISEKEKDLFVRKR